MDDRELRLECLRLAVEHGRHAQVRSAEQLADIASSFYDFIEPGTEVAPRRGRKRGDKSKPDPLS